MTLQLIWITKIVLLLGLWAKSSGLNVFFYDFLHVFCFIISLCTKYFKYIIGGAFKATIKTMNSVVLITTR